MKPGVKKKKLLNAMFNLQLRWEHAPHLMNNGLSAQSPECKISAKLAKTIVEAKNIIPFRSRRGRRLSQSPSTGM